ncbi:MAG TPA: hypothetical protein PLD92_05770, partial [Candidatus Omnitrophota bacterium]|nr:hypothetical protein [Candidatus Omnitrophota bacterium]
MIVLTGAVGVNLKHRAKASSCGILFSYFLFMPAWLHVFKYTGFVALLRTALALSAGMINCKESFFQERGQPDHP